MRGAAVVARGQDLYESVLADPIADAQGPPVARSSRCFYVASRRTSARPDSMRQANSIRATCQFETFSNEEGMAAGQLTLRVRRDT